MYASDIADQATFYAPSSRADVHRPSTRPNAEPRSTQSCMISIWYDARHLASTS